MKGIIFTTLGDLVEERYGFETWTHLLESTPLASHGIYTTGGTYSDEELFALVTRLSQEKDIPIQTLIEAFGMYMFPVLVKKYPIFVKPDMSLKTFLQSVDSIIHIEVLKLNPGARLPTIASEDLGDAGLVMNYRSPRKLCALAIGLIKGAALHFNTSVKVLQPQCMHEGAEFCRLEVYIEKQTDNTVRL